jgi:hypothetical protein
MHGEISGTRRRAWNVCGAIAVSDPPTVTRMQDRESCLSKLQGSRHDEISISRFASPFCSTNLQSQVQVYKT